MIVHFQYAGRSGGRAPGGGQVSSNDKGAWEAGSAPEAGEKKLDGAPAMGLRSSHCGGNGPNAQHSPWPRVGQRSGAPRRNSPNSYQRPAAGKVCCGACVCSFVSGRVNFPSAACRPARQQPWDTSFRPPRGPRCTLWRQSGPVRVDVYGFAAGWRLLR
jgi:hypothetical protein